MDKNIEEAAGDKTSSEIDLTRQWSNESVTGIGAQKR
jgi:hypothetical protein